MTSKRDALLALARKSGANLKRPAIRTVDNVSALTGYWPSWEKNVKRTRR